MYVNIFKILQRAWDSISCPQPTLIKMKTSEKGPLLHGFTHGYSEIMSGIPLTLESQGLFSKSLGWVH